MKFILGKDRNQTAFFCLDQITDQNNDVRLIDLFVGSLALSEFGFKWEFIENGLPAYHSSGLLRLFICGYMNCICSSSLLENASMRNLEVMWHMRGGSGSPYNFQFSKKQSKSHTKGISGDCAIGQEL